MRALIFLVTLVAWSGSVRASCDDKLDGPAQSLTKILTDIFKGRLDDNVAFRLRTPAKHFAAADVEKLRSRVAHFGVKLEVLETKPASVEYLIEGNGRFVIMALMDLKELSERSQAGQAPSRPPEVIGPIVPSETPTGTKLENLLRQTVSSLDLTDRAIDALIHQDIFFLGDVVEHSEEAMLRLPNISKATVHHIKLALAPLGLLLGMEVADWPYQDLDDVSLAMAKSIYRPPVFSADSWLKRSPARANDLFDVKKGGLSLRKPMAIIKLTSSTAIVAINGKFLQTRRAQLVAGYAIENVDIYAQTHIDRDDKDRLIIAIANLSRSQTRSYSTTVAAADGTVGHKGAALFANLVATGEPAVVKGNRSSDDIVFFSVGHSPMLN